MPRKLPEQERPKIRQIPERTIAPTQKAIVAPATNKNTPSGIPMLPERKPVEYKKPVMLPERLPSSKPEPIKPISMGNKPTTSPTVIPERKPVAVKTPTLPEPKRPLYAPGQLPDQSSGIARRIAERVPSEGSRSIPTLAIQRQQSVNSSVDELVRLLKSQMGHKLGPQGNQLSKNVELPDIEPLKQATVEKFTHQ